MNAFSILLAVSLSASPALAEQPTLTSLALKIQALEQQVEALKADVVIAKKEKDGDAKRPEIVINILKDGKIRIEGQKLGDEALPARIGPILTKFPNQPICIIAARDIKYQEMVRVFDLCQQAGASNLSFATSKD